MTGEEILKGFLIKLHAHYGLAIADIANQVNLGTVDVGIDLLIADASIAAKPTIVELLESLREANFGADYLQDPYVEPVQAEIIDFSGVDFRKRHRPFSYSDPEYGFLSLKKLFENNPLRTVAQQPVDFRVLIDFISKMIISNNDAELDSLIDKIENTSSDFGLLIQKVNVNLQVLPVYSFIYYKKMLNGEAIKRDPRLDYNLVHGATAVFNNAIIYQQYFEVYDIINELNHANDLITRFLKLYHIIEYLVYRAELVQIEQKARTNRTFIREIHGLIGAKTTETSVLNKNFEEIFRVEIAANYFDLGALTPDQCKFLNEMWKLKFNTTTSTIDMKVPGNVVKLIYGIRNSIVHNKESEFHLTTSNPDDYLVVIDIIKNFTKILERQVFDKITANAPKISYGSPNIALY